MIYVVIGLGLVVAAPEMEVKDPQERVGMQLAGGMFAVIGLIAVAISWTMAALQLLAGDYLRQRRGHTFCLVVASLECLNMPLGRSSACSP